MERGRVKGFIFPLKPFEDGLDCVYAPRGKEAVEMEQNGKITRALAAVPENSV